MQFEELEAGVWAVSDGPQRVGALRYIGSGQWKLFTDKHEVSFESSNFEEAVQTIGQLFVLKRQEAFISSEQFEQFMRTQLGALMMLCTFTNKLPDLVYSISNFVVSLALLKEDSSEKIIEEFCEVTKVRLKAARAAKEVHDMVMSSVERHLSEILKGDEEEQSDNTPPKPH